MINPYSLAKSLAINYPPFPSLAHRWNAAAAALSSSFLCLFLLLLSPSPFGGGEAPNGTQSWAIQPPPKPANGIACMGRGRVHDSSSPSLFPLFSPSISSRLSLTLTLFHRLSHSLSPSHSSLPLCLFVRPAAIPSATSGPPLFASSATRRHGQLSRPLTSTAITANSIQEPRHLAFSLSFHQELRVVPPHSP